MSYLKTRADNGTDLMITASACICALKNAIDKHGLHMRIFLCQFWAYVYIALLV